MRVLVLRPQPSADRTARKLAALGHLPVLLPLAEARHDLQAARAALAEPHSAIAITSGEAARMLRSLGDEIEGHLSTTVFAVGRASARGATEAGFRTVLTPEGDGRDLADLVIGRMQDHGRSGNPLLYLAGQPRAPDFEARLKEAGIGFTTVTCYYMEPIRPSEAEIRSIVFGTPPDAGLFYSRDSARRFFGLPPITDHPELLDGMRMLCMSDNVATAIPQRFAASVTISPVPDEASLLGLL